MKKMLEILKRIYLVLRKKNWYKCAMCGKIFKSGWSEEEAKEEYKQNFPNDKEMKLEIDLVCDDCYKLLPISLSNTSPELDKGFSIFLKSIVDDPDFFGCNLKIDDIGEPLGYIQADYIKKEKERED